MICTMILLADTVSAAKRMPARPNRFAIGFGFGYGSGHFSEFNTLVNDINGYAASKGINVTSPTTASSAINVEFTLRYYSPWYVMLQVGYDTLYNWGKEGLMSGTGKLTFDNLVMEVPILLGGFYPIAGRFYVYGAVGPSIQFFRRSYWDSEIGSAGVSVSDYKTDTSVGLHWMVGVSWAVIENFSIGLELRYRNVKSGVMKGIDSDFPITSGMLRSDGSRDNYRLDFTGIGFEFTIRALL